MGKKAKYMKYDLKISLPFYKVIYSIVFMALLLIVRGISMSGEVLVVLEPNVGLLAGVFLADNYYKEFSNGNIQVFYRYSLAKKMSAVCRRYIIGCIYLWLLVVIAYVLYMVLYYPLDFTYKKNMYIMINTLGVCGVSILFFGILSFTITNFAQNVGIGIGIFLGIWLGLNSMFSRYLPKCLQLFLLEESSQQQGDFTPYYISRFVYLILTILLISLNVYALKKEPKYKRKEWGYRHENTN